MQNARRTALLSSAAAPAFMWDFTSNTLPPWLTFSNGSINTQFDVNGAMAYPLNNSAINSNGFTSSGWGAVSNGSLTSGIANPFSGLNDGWALVETNATGGHNFGSSGANGYNLNAGDAIIASVYLWQGNNRYAAFGVSFTGAGFTTPHYGVMDFQTGTFTLAQGGSDAFGTVGVQNLGGGLYRVYHYIKTTVAMTTGFMTIYGANGATFADRSYTGVTNNVAVNFAYAQIERVTTATTPSTYIPTTSTVIFAPRFDYDPVTKAAKGLRIERAATNLLIGSAMGGANLATQNVTVSAVSYLLSFYGTGTVTLSGTATASVVGAGAFPTRKVFQFTPTAGTLTLTVTGTVQYAQLETGSNAAMPSSFIPTVSAAVSRNADLVPFTGTPLAALLARDMSVIVQAQLTGSADFDADGVIIGSANSQNEIRCNGGSSTVPAVSVGNVSLNASVVSLAFASPFRVAFGANSGGRSFVANNGTLVSDGSTTWGAAGVPAMYLGSQNGGRGLNGWVQSLAIYLKRLPDGVLKAKSVPGAGY